jgi:hypothetical protein
MAAVIYVANAFDGAPQAGCPRVILEDTAVYWFLYRYFEAANLPPAKEELIDLYGAAEIGGYQLERLIEELRVAEADARARPAEWSVLLGWHGEKMGRETERRAVLKREDALATIGSILALAGDAQKHGRKLISSGD